MNAQSDSRPTIAYRIDPIDPAAHVFEVTLTIANPASSGQVLRMPAWIPGSYMVREFAKNITHITASAGGVPVRLEQLSKDTWQAAAGLGKPSGALIVTCRVYAYELSVRTAYLDAQQALLNFSNLCLAVVGQEHLPCSLTIVQPAVERTRIQQNRTAADSNGWQVATSLPLAKASHSFEGAVAAKHRGFGQYTAANYDALIDHPMQLGAQQWGSFAAHGAQHEIAIVGRAPALDMPRLVKDSAAICAAQIALFEPDALTAPFLDSAAHYTFMTQAVGEGYGGLEHRASTALIAKRSDLPCTIASTVDHTLSAGYQQYLGLVSHEYFHTWNVKRIKPAVFAPYELSQEAYTPLLWLFEGFTAYYDDLMVRRAGITTQQQYLDTLATTASGVLRGSGRLQQSAASASFNAWVKYYRPDENSPNALSSYYTQGSLIALHLDLHIRLKTNHALSLDDVMRFLWRHFGRDFYGNTARSGLGLTVQDVYHAFREATGLHLKPLIETLTHTAADIPLAPLLAKFGVVWTQSPVNTHGSAAASLGASTRAAGNDCVIATAYSGEAAHRAGLSGGDVLVALDGLRVTPASLPALLARLPAGTTVPALAWRRDELIDTVITLDAAPKTLVKLSVKQTHLAHTAARSRWLG
jgi:predicted metalloprotease with PDZ domain